MTPAELARLGMRLQDARDTVRRFLGEERYAERVTPIRKLLRDVAAQRNTTILRVAIDGAGSAAASDGSGIAALCILAAACDEMEEGT